MSKANSKGRKRANRKPQAKVEKKAVLPVKSEKDIRNGIQPLYQQETIVFNELVELSNQFAKLKKQYDQYEFIKVNLIARRTKIQKGEIKLPISIQLTQDMYYAEDDKKKILKLFDEQIKTITDSTIAVKQQVDIRRDMYIESGLRLLTFATQRYGGCRMEEFGPRGPTANKDELKLAEKEYDELFKADAADMQKPEIQKAFKTAMELAKKKNKVVKK